MAKNNKYHACDADGVRGASVSNAAEFKDFCVFMSDQSEKVKAIRKKAYEKISETGEATPKAKIEFIRSCSLEYIKAQLKSGNSLSAQALSNDASEWDEEVAEKFVSAMGREFRGFLVAVGSDVFDGMLLASSMTEQARRALVRALWSGDEFASKIIDAALRAESGQAAKALATWRKSPEARASLNSACKVEMAADRLSLDAKYGVYAPLLKFLTEHMGVAQKAEYFARFEDYANSGFLDQDLALVDGVRKDGLYGTPAAHAWKEMASMVMTGQEPQPTAQDVRLALHRRLAEVGMKINVSSVKRSSSATWTASHSPLRVEDLNELAVTAQVDCFTICSDKTALVSFVTSDCLASKQNSQWARHFIAVEGSLKELELSGASYRALMPCLIADHPVHGGSQAAGAPLANWFSGHRKLSEHMQGVINAAPFMLELMNGSKTILATSDKGGIGSWSSKMHLELIGSDRNAWPLAQAAIAAAENPDLEFDRQMLTMAGHLLDGMASGANLRGGDAKKISGVQTVDKSGPQLNLLVKFIAASVKNCRMSKDLGILEVAKSIEKKLKRIDAALEPGSSAMEDLRSSSDSIAALLRDLSKAKKAKEAQSVSKNAAKAKKLPVKKKAP